MIIKNQYFVEIKSIVRLLKLYLQKKNQCLPGYEQGFRPPPPPYAMNFLFLDSIYFTLNVTFSAVDFIFPCISLRHGKNKSSVHFKQKE